VVGVGTIGEEVNVFIHHIVSSHDLCTVAVTSDCVAKYDGNSHHNLSELSTIQLFVVS
jgi:hypothetical protein